MRVKKISEEVQQKAKTALTMIENKEDAIAQAIEIITTAQNEDLINQLVEESERAAHDAEYKKSLGLRNLSADEKQFYEGFADIKQSITASQIDIIPTEIIDRTLDEVKKASKILSLVRFAPAGVSKWLVASKTGAAAWGTLSDKVKGELTATITSLNIDINKLTAYLVIPKSIGKLGLPFVDKYFRAILAEAMQDGLVNGYLNGDGKTGPIGILRKVNDSNSDGTKKEKTKLTNVTKMSPKGLAGVRKTLCKNGLRVVDKIYLICNPLDEAEYVDPCLYGECLTGGYGNKSFVAIEKIPDANCPEGTAIFTVDGYYTMGIDSVEVKNYDQTLAMDDADLIIAKCNGNGRATDDSVAVPIDVTKLEEYVLPVTHVTVPTAGA